MPGIILDGPLFSGQSVPRTPSGSVLHHVTRACQRLDMVFNRVAADAGNLCCLGDSHPTAFTAQFKNLYREFRQITKNQTFALNLFLKPRFLLLQGFQKKSQPWLPVWLVRAIRESVPSFRGKAESFDPTQDIANNRPARFLCVTPNLTEA
jgi:hypothetical protein